MWLLLLLLLILSLVLLLKISSYSMTILPVPQIPVHTVIIIITTLRSSPVLQPMRTSPAGVQQWTDGWERSQLSVYSANCSASSPWSPATAETGSSRLALVVTLRADPTASFASFVSYVSPFGGILYFLLHDNTHITAISNIHTIYRKKRCLFSHQAC